MERIFGYDGQVVAAQGYPELPSILLYTAGSCAFYFLLTTVCKIACSRWNEGEKDAKKHFRPARYAGYVCSMVNAIHVSLFSFYKVLFFPVSDLHGNVFTVCCLLGYLVHDLFDSLPEIKKTPSNTGHHLLGIGIVGTLVYSQIVVAFIPHFIVMEASTILLNLMWFLREHKRQNHPVYPWAAKGFALSFLLIRVIWYPILVYGIYTYQLHEWLKFPLIMRYGLIPALYFLQVFWFVKIVQLAMNA